MKDLKAWVPSLTKAPLWPVGLYSVLWKRKAEIWVQFYSVKIFCSDCPLNHSFLLHMQENAVWGSVFLYGVVSRWLEKYSAGLIVAQLGHPDIRLPHVDLIARARIHVHMFLTAWPLDNRCEKLHWKYSFCFHSWHPAPGKGVGLGLSGWVNLVIIEGSEMF